MSDEEQQYEADGMLGLQPHKWTDIPDSNVQVMIDFPQRGGFQSLKYRLKESKSATRRKASS